MLKNSTHRRIDMTLLNKDGSIRVNDTGTFWSEEDLDWRYNFCWPFEENEKSLLKLVYGETEVKYSLSANLSAYLENRKNIAPNAYFSILSAISESVIPDEDKTELLQVINSQLHRRNPYK